MPPKSLLFALLLVASVSACSDPKCPPPYMQYGERCRLCPPGQNREQGKCVPIRDGGESEPDQQDEPHDDAHRADAAEDDDSTTVDTTGVDGSVTTRDAERGGGTEPDGGGIHPPDGAPEDAGSGNDDGALDVDECASTNICSSPDYPCEQTLAPGYICRGQFADWPMPDAVAGSRAKPDYDIVTIPGVVIDNTTGLLWQRTLPATRFSPVATYSGCTGMRDMIGDTCSWTEAKAYCEDLALGGRSEWRLPSKIELESISDHTRVNPAIDPAFPNTPVDSFWTSSRVDGRSSDAWSIFAGNGSSTSVLPPTTARVRCVLGSPRPGRPEDRYVVEASEDRVTDTRTGLVWQRSIAASKYTWTAALSHCPARGAGWRLPTLKELLTLIDPATSFPAIDRAAFPSTPQSEAFWSATPAVGAEPFVAWYVEFLNGNASMRSDGELTVRCVR
jgi:Protein of unknown function (DUF1566)